ERMAINEAEYRRLFEGEPVRDRPRLVSASAGGAAPPPETGPSPTGAPSEGFVPASPYLQGLAEDISGGVIEQATRRVITSADRGRFELLDYICTGEGPIVLKERDLAYFGFAANVDQTTGALRAFNSDEDIRAWFGATNIRRLDASWSEAMVKFLTNMFVRGVLIVVFVLALFIAMTHPGLLVPEGVAMLALVALLAPPFLIGMANWWEIAAILFGIGLIVLEIFVFPGFGVPGVLGLLLLFGGLLGTFIEDTPGGLFPDSPKAQTDMLYAVLTIVLALTTSGIGVYFLSKHFGSLPIVSGLVLRDTIGKPADDTDDEFLAALGDPDDVGVSVGDEATTVTPLRPAGRVEINGRLVDVVAEMGYIPEGRRVRVVSVGKFRVGVEEVATGPQGERA
ncbi:MAG TPA: NfeD family protein, partial [Phycisphaerales bacterium]|nr:NfeD family protein [Phycisphaerales bacterium]